MRMQHNNIYMLVNYCQMPNFQYVSGPLKKKTAIDVHKQSKQNKTKPILYLFYTITNERSSPQMLMCKYKMIMNTMKMQILTTFLKQSTLFRPSKIYKLIPHTITITNSTLMTSIMSSIKSPKNALKMNA